MLGLQEAVAVGMADGYAQASGRPALVNLHTAPGVGNAMGAIFNAQANKSPLRGHRRPAGALADDAAGATSPTATPTRMPHPLVKWSYEPPRAEDVPHALARGDPPRRAAAARARRSSRSRWTTGTPRSTTTRSRHQTDAHGRRPRRRRPGGGARRSRERLAAAANPVLVAGPGRRRERRLGRRGRARRARSGCRCGRRPPPAAGGIGFPEDHPHFQGVLPPAVGPLSETLAGHDLVLVVGSSVFPYYPNIPGPLLPEGAALVAITSDPDEAARAPMGDAIVADVGARRSRRSLAARRASPSAPAPEPRAGPPSRPRSPTR